MNTADPVAPATILIVDDIPANLGTMVKTLESHGFRVVVAQDGEEGLQRAELVRPDLILLDVMMPCMDGFETCRLLKASASTRDIPVIFMTALAESDSKLAGFAAGGVDYLTKPFDVAEVLARVNTHLSLRAMQARLAEQNLELKREQAERQRLNEELKDRMDRLAHLSHRLVMVQEEERRRLAAMLHDRVSPNLAILKINLGFVNAELATKCPAEFESRVSDTCALLDDTSASIREICTDLRSAVLDYYGLVRALDSYGQQFAARTGIAVAVRGTDAGERLPSGLESVLFRIAQEALTNCAKHSGAKSVEIELAHDDAHTRLTITDDGVGFDPTCLGDNGQVPGLGLLTMRERAEFVGGTFDVDSGRNRGTRITVSL